MLYNNNYDPHIMFSHQNTVYRAKSQTKNVLLLFDLNHCVIRNNGFPKRLTSSSLFAKIDFVAMKNSYNGTNEDKQ